MDDDPQQALRALWPRLRELAPEPVHDEDDYVERLAFQKVAFEVQFIVRHAGTKPDEVVNGWDEHFVVLVRENGRAGSRIKKNNSLEGRIELRRQELFAAGSPIVVPPAEPTGLAVSPAAVATAVKAALPPEGNRTRLSKALQDFLNWREGDDGDRRAENDVSPVIQFAVDLWNDPCIGDIGPDQLVALKSALPEIPTPTGFDQNQRSLFQRWSIANENDYIMCAMAAPSNSSECPHPPWKRYRTA
ncbi:hypothetical protein HUU61_23130 [Rhodopseudomonas palustris]|uniref:Uncharacterized protein n=1 Tax=Thiospirillum jenense TaxID=1653858 RepID=A0A839HKG9_9GAMM|nr:hypothetical protein [Thiospirillum jenense]MBB1094168.1 hypothetical protein [Rhodopseudomonas palustris]MBB1127336.1 hypothetical protein [Thiospirillum jenense]